MRIGLLFDRFTGVPPARLGDHLRRVAEKAEAAGAASLWINDHLLQIPAFGAADDPVLEAWTTLSHLAARTDRIELGTLTTSVTHRSPALLLKTVTTVDVLSGGRMWFGVGPPWYEHEHRALGLPLPEWPERFERLEEVLRLAHQVWAGDRTPVAGRHHRLPEPVFVPGPLRRPPILVGGAHERRLLPLVARYADACSFAEAGGPQMLALKLRMLRRACATGGRPFGEIIRTTYGSLDLSGTSVPAAVDRFTALAEAGIHQAVVSPAGDWGDRQFAALAAVVEAVSELPAKEPQ